MKTLVTLDISDEQRNQLACAIAGKLVKRLASRDEVRDYVNGAIARLNEVKAELERAGAPDVTPPSVGNHSLKARSTNEEAQIAKLRAEGRSEGYIIGWLKPGRPSAFSSQQQPVAPVEHVPDFGDPSP